MARIGQARAAADLVAAVAACQRCPLARSGRPSLTAPPTRTELLILGEAPGLTESVAGSPFVGRSGQILTRALFEAGIRREQAYITNVVLHRPSDADGHDRHPRAAEVRACSDWLDVQLRLVQPRVVLALGQVAVGRLLGTATTLEAVRGRAQRCGDRWVVPTYHPASLNRSADRPEAFRSDLALAADLLGL